MAQAPRTTNTVEPPISVGLAQAMSNPWRFRILTELTTRSMSATQFAEEVGGEQSNISRRFKQLVDWGYLELVEEKSGGARRGGVERIYRTRLAARVEAATWKALPSALRDDLSRNVLELLSRRINEALEAGTFDKEPDRHLSEVRAILDRPALARLGELLDEVLDMVPELEDEARGRIYGEETEAMPVTLGLLAFRSPTDEERRGAR